MSTSDEIRLLTYDEAVALLPDGESIHTIVDAGTVLLGADWDRTAILELLSTSPRREIPGPHALSARHGLAAADEDGRTIFIETRRT